jgi:cellulose biosynthesis protein BcsQ
MLFHSERVLRKTGGEAMLRTITLCSGKGGVGKTLLATTLARIIQQEENCNVLLADLDVSVRGLTLLAFQNKIELDQVPASLVAHSKGEAETS